MVDVDLDGLTTKDLESITAVAVMGVTGSGKSNFIKHASQSDKVRIGPDLQSCKYWLYKSPATLE